ncbi:MAG: glycine--tRNA ligase subunit beta [Burkholderiales bacterium]|nr:glycine--tRNA ligase subunit beta [Burkholderiales bacterium]
MSNTRSLLVELLCEELPPRALLRLSESFAQTLAAELAAAGLCASDATVMPYATPRRLAVHIAGVVARAADKPLRQKLMPVAVGLDAAGNASPALQKRLAALGLADVQATQLIREMDGKAESLFVDTVVSGALLADALQKSLETAIARLPIPKVMQYQLESGCDQPGWTSVSFVRPVHGLVALHGDDTLPLSLLGLQAGRRTRGHRFEALQPWIDVREADTYARQLAEEGAVVASFAERRALITRQLAAAASKVGGGVRPIDDDALLDEVTALVERPNVLVGQFDVGFLAVPQECLILTMKANQRYFPLVDVAGQLTNRFLLVSNISPADPSAVIAGNERVVRPRLADAQFFYEQDRKVPLAERAAGLDRVVYHNRLGTQGDRSRRVGAIAHAIVEQLRMATVPYTAEAKDGFDVLDSKVQEAARLAKADLLTDMVGEFPELQGVMGGYYARHEGLRDGVAIAVEDHYRPRFAGDALPRNHTGTVLALADKLETLVGLFGVGEKPTGDRDPFALRRQALGVIRILAENNLPLDLPALLQAALPAFGERIEDPSAALLEFLYDRLAVSLRDEGYTAQEVDAVLALRPPRLGDVPRRLEAVRAFAALPEAAALAAANKRVGNILRKSATAPGEVDAQRLVEHAEKLLHAALEDTLPAADAAFDHGDYTASLKALAALRASVDAFFDGVMVNAEEPALRANRLALLARLHAAMNRVADLGRLAA